MSIDVNDLNFHAFDVNIKLGYNEAKYKISVRKIAFSLLILIAKGLASLFYFLKDRYDQEILPCDVAMFAFSEANNKRCLQPLVPNVAKSTLFTDENLMLKRIWFYAMVYSPVVLFRCITYKGKQQRFYCRFFISFCKAFGTYKEARNILRSMRPRMVIVANDHSYTSRCFFRAAQELGINTAYVQHASVNKYFPPLEFDYAFLDGRESYDKYIDGKPCRSVVYLSGNPRFDIISKLKLRAFRPEDRKIGIAVNPLDQVIIIEELISLIKTSIPGVEISIRPHPSSDMIAWEQTCKHLNCTLSNSFEENPFVFINRHQLFISGNSSFHLDVSMAGKQSFFYNFSGKVVVDAYNYLKNNLVKDISLSPINAIIGALESPHLVLNEQAQYYVGNFNTEYWGRSAELIGRTITELLANKKDIACWNLVKEDNVFTIQKSKR